MSWGNTDLGVPKSPLWTTTTTTTTTITNTTKVSLFKCQSDLGVYYKKEFTKCPVRLSRPPREAF